MFAWEGLTTLMPSNPGASSPTPKAEAATHTSKEVVSVGSRTESVEDPQFQELLYTRSQQAQTIRALQGVIGKKTHDLQAIRNWRPTANAVGNIYLCPCGTVWHACEVSARQRTNAELVMRRP